MTQPSSPTPHFYSSSGGCLLRLMTMIIAVMAGAWLLPGVHVSSFGAALLTAIAISLLNNLVRPILIVITLPATALTLGLFLFVINAVVILMASAIVGGFQVDNFWSAMLFSFVLTVINYLLEWPNRHMQRHNFTPRSHSDNDPDSENAFTPYEEIND